MFSTSFFVGLLSLLSLLSLEATDINVLYVFFRKMWPWKPHEAQRDLMR